MKKSEEKYVFVYGTLKRGEGNHRLMGDSRFVGEVQTSGDFMMFGSGFPLCREPVDGDNLHQAGKVKGEVFAVNKSVLAALDSLEGHPTFYERRITRMEEFPATEIWMYHWNSNGGRIGGGGEHMPRRSGIDMIHNWKSGAGW